MWELVRELREAGVTIILTTHYIEEAEEMADRVGVISKGRILLVEEKAELMRKMGAKQLTLHLHERLAALPDALAGDERLMLAEDGLSLVFTYDSRATRTGVTSLLAALNQAGVSVKDLQTSSSSLEDIFVSLVREDA